MRPLCGREIIDKYRDINELLKEEMIKEPGGG
jgi:hypothetical protein